MTDLDRFVELYRTFGIECNVNKKDSGYEIVLSEHTCYADGATRSDKFDGYCGMFTTISFDGDGKFIKQGFWE